MIAESAVTAATPFDSIQRKLLAFVETSRALSANGLTWAEFGELLVALVRMAVETLDQTAGLTGPEKKSLVLDAVAALFDAVADRAIPAYAWPVWVLVSPAIRSLVLALASGAVEQILQLVRSTW